MPLIDMPVEKLENYKGTNPKPIDFDEYWDMAITEMKSITPKVCISKAEYNKMTCKKKHILYPDYGHEYLKDSDDMIFGFFNEGLR